jgi:tRNA (cmo5U34)-methyltransferase
MSARPTGPSAHFDEARAAVYDDQFAALRALKDCIHLLIEAHFASLPDDARVLVAGAGTGAEVRYLAARFPNWRFTLVDPSAPMLAVARRHAEAEQFVDRCSFHADFLAGTPVVAHDAATSLLVSHFLTDAPARQSYFADIADRVEPGGRLFTVDLCTDDDAPSFAGVMGLWIDLLVHAGMTPEARERYLESYGRDFAAQGPDAVAGMMEAAGFTSPVPIFQAALMRGWTTAKAQ